MHTEYIAYRFKLLGLLKYSKVKKAAQQNCGNTRDSEHKPAACPHTKQVMVFFLSQQHGGSMRTQCLSLVMPSTGGPHSMPLCMCVSA